MRLSVFLILALSTTLVVGCGPGGSFPVESTSGVVMCEGRPVPHVTVFFEPLGSEGSALVGKQGIGFADENGKFVVSTYGDHDGAVVGKHRVRVGGPRGDSHPDFTCPCTVNSETDVMEVEVKKDSKNEFQVVLTKKTGREKPSLEELEAHEEAKQEAKERAMARR
jgi:hypothetical protein